MEEEPRDLGPMMVESLLRWGTEAQLYESSMKKVVDEQCLKASKKPKNQQLFTCVMQRLQGD